MRLLTARHQTVEDQGRREDEEPDVEGVVEQEEQQRRREGPGAEADAAVGEVPGVEGEERRGEQGDEGVVANLAQMEHQRDTDRGEEQVGAGEGEPRPPAPNRGEHPGEGDEHTRGTGECEGKTHQRGLRAQVVGKVGQGDAGRGEVEVPPGRPDVGIRSLLDAVGHVEPELVDDIAGAVHLGVTVLEHPAREGGGLPLVLPEERIRQAAEQRHREDRERECEACPSDRCDRAPHILPRFGRGAQRTT